ncbi:nicotinate (nicotinamide) nucleotide adenylyltransferase [Cryptococcus sp. DSM 104549]
MASNGFKSPAPVLPAMGLHSFHNDSPPFAGAATSEHGEPAPMSLDPTRVLSPLGDGTRPLVSPSSLQPDAPTAPAPSHPQAAASAAASGSAAQPITSPSRTSLSDDEHLSSSRSRRLVSGYLFGNPPSPTAAHIPPQPLTSTAVESQDSVTSKRFSPTLETLSLGSPPPREDTDSPPLSDPEREKDASPRQLPDMDDTPAPPAGATGKATPPAHVGLNEPLSADAGASGSTGAGVPGVLSAKTDKSKTADRDRDTGYDALYGRNDGEADLDLSAPQAEGAGSEAYLQGKGEYAFPRHRLRKTMKDESKIPLVIVACGSFSPPTYLHLRMFEMAKDEILESQTYEIMAGYYSPVSSYYKKSGLAPAKDRVRMCELAVEHTSTWLMVDPWEAGQPEYQRTAVVLDHLDEMLNGGKDGEGGLVRSDGTRRRYKIMLLAGGDLIESFGEPGVWSEPDLHIILGRFGCLIVERAGSDVWAFLLSHDILYHHRRNVIVIKQLIYNDISSTKVRLFVRRGMSIKYLLPNSVIQYIYDHKLYRGSDTKRILGR